MGKLAGVLFLILTGPLWVVGLALVPVYFIERLCYYGARRGLLRFLTAWRAPIAPPSPLSSFERYKAKSRNARRAHKAVRL